MSLNFDFFGLRISEGRLCHSFFNFLGIRVLEEDVSLKLYYYGLRVSKGGSCHSFFIFLGIRILEGGMCH